jgi:hypothetical protein
MLKGYDDGKIVIFYEPRDKMEYDIVLNKTEVTVVELVSLRPKTH